MKHSKHANAKCLIDLNDKTIKMQTLVLSLKIDNIQINSLEFPLLAHVQ